MIKFFDGVPVTVTNKIVNDNQEEKYYISFNSSTRGYGVKTTALVIYVSDGVYKRQLFYILEGDHSKSFAECKNLKECVNYYMTNKELIHKYSDTFEHEYLINNKG